MYSDVDTSYAHFSANLRRFRRERGWSQEVLARLAGVSRPTIAHLELGTRVGGTSWRIIDSLCGALGVPLAKLLASGSDDAPEVSLR